MLMTSLKNLSALVAGAIVLMTATTAIAAPKKSEYVFLTGTAPHFTAIVVGVRKGFCKELGLNIRFKQFTSGGVAAQSFIAGQGDFVNTGEWPAVRTWLVTKGKVVGLQSTWTEGELMVVVASKDIKTAQDLKGKKIGVWLGTTSEYFAGVYLHENGIDESAVDFINVKPAEMVIALDKGDLSAFFVWQPFGWRSEEVSGGKVKILEDGDKYIKSYMVTSARRNMFDEDPDAVTALLACTRKGGEYATKNIDEAAQIIGKEYKVPPELAKRMIEAAELDVSYTPRFRKDLEGVNNFMKSKGKSDSEIDWSKHFDPRGLKSVDPALVN
jgi:ABC-type nitrate/sulfonate/bicarbonate transport system substrate-binding protein